MTNTTDALTSMVGALEATTAKEAGSRPSARVDLDPSAPARDLACLVLTVVELLRQLMERQAIRRLDRGDLAPEKEEQLGTALMLLDQRMGELCERHGVRREDLGLDLGPLGTLLSKDW